MNKLLITGASGFIGRAFLSQIKQADLKEFEIYAIGNDHLGTDSTFRWYKCNLLNQRDTDKLFDNVRPSHLLHLAWCSNHGTYWTDEANLEWVKATINIAQNFAKYGGQRCVFIGTSAEYNWSLSKKLTEDSEIKPDSLYGGSKSGLYSVVSKFFDQQNISWAWARLFNTFGKYENPKRLIPRICISLLKGEAIKFDSGLTYRDFLAVEDVANALIKVLANNINGPVNIASGVSVSIKELVSQIATHYNKSDLISFDDLPSASVNNNFVVADVTKLTNIYKWSPTMNIFDRLDNICDWWEYQINKTTLDEKH